MVTRPAINDSASDRENISANPPLIIDVEGALKTHYAPFLKWPKWGQRLAGWLLRLIICQDRINRFLAVHGQLHAFDFIEKIFDELGFCYQINTGEIENIPAKGGVIIIANHPLGALDGLSLVHMVGQVRRDVKIVANQLLSSIPPIAPLLLPVNNMAGESRRTDLQNISRALEEGQAVIFFPAGEVSRLSPRGIRDREWDSGFLRFAERLNMPVLPIYIRARNSGLFYTISRFSAVLSMLMLPREMIKTSGQLHFFTSPVIRPEQFLKLPVSRKQKVKLFRKHIYQLAKGRQPVFVTQASIIHPVDRQALKAELSAAEELGKTSDNKRILLCSVQPSSVLLDELGRLREEAFRAVGEGTGRKKDIDRFDPYYRHIIVWDEELLEIAGAYRLGEVWKWYAELSAVRSADRPECNSTECDTRSRQELVDKLYSAELFEFDGKIDRVFGAGLELGRSFVQPRFWGKRSLDYLWQGIGAYVAR
ncbi:MAG: GNAT family N-acyltransferase, partial [Candidatus Puniceispirillaceae bacterium]